jgi:hypothetical protein
MTEKYKVGARELSEETIMVIIGMMLDVAESDESDEQKGHQIQYNLTVLSMEYAESRDNEKLIATRGQLNEALRDCFRRCDRKVPRRYVNSLFRQRWLAWCDWCTALGERNTPEMEPHHVH